MYHVKRGNSLSYQPTLVWKQKGIIRIKDNLLQKTHPEIVQLNPGIFQILLKKLGFKISFGGKC